MSEDQASEKRASEAGLSRRDVIIGAGALASVAAGQAAASSHGHDHAQHATRHPKLFAALQDCLATTQTCIAHCIQTFQEGDTTLADCARVVQETDAICGAMSYLVAANSRYEKDQAKICLRACQDCSAECRKHAKAHQECRDCMEACDAAVVELKALLA